MDLIPSSDSQSSPSSAPIQVISASFPPKNLWWILGGFVLASTCGYLGYSLYKRKLVNVRNLILESQDEKSLIDILNEIRICYTSFYITELKQHRKIRRRYPRNSDAYAKAVAEFQLKLIKTIQESIDEILKKYSLSEREIDICIEHHSKNYKIVKAFDDLLEALYMGRRHFDFALGKTKRRRLETCRNLEPQTHAEEIGLGQAQIEDEIFEKYGREREEVEAVLNPHSHQINEIAHEAASEVSQRLSQDLDDLDSK